jgi:hypothetical protein
MVMTVISVGAEAPFMALRRLKAVFWRGAGLVRDDRVHLELD